MRNPYEYLKSSLLPGRGTDELVVIAVVDRDRKPQVGECCGVGVGVIESGQSTRHEVAVVGNEREAQVGERYFCGIGVGVIGSGRRTHEVEQCLVVLTEQANERRTAAAALLGARRIVLDVALAAVQTEVLVDVDGCRSAFSVIALRFVAAPNARIRLVATRPRPEQLTIALWPAEA